MNTDTCCQRPDTGVKFFFYLNRLNLLNLSMKLLHPSVVGVGRFRSQTRDKRMAFADCSRTDAIVE